MDNTQRQNILDLLDQACAADIFAAVSREEWIEEIDTLPASALALLPRHLIQIVKTDATRTARRARPTNTARRETLSAGMVTR